MKRTAFVCPNCEGGFDTPTRVTKRKRVLLGDNKIVRAYACPWCHHMMRAGAKSGDAAKYDAIKEKVKNADV